LELLALHEEYGEEKDMTMRLKIFNKLKSMSEVEYNKSKNKKKVCSSSNTTAASSTNEYGNQIRKARNGMKPTLNSKAAHLHSK